MRATIKEVAKLAGVSIATVSRVFNGPNLVLDETRKTVEEAARSLKYSPNPTARSLSRRKTETIGMLLPDLHGEFFSEVIRGSDLTARRNGFHLIVSSSHNDRAEIQAALRAMTGRVDGLIVMSPLVDAQTLIDNLPSSLPLVLLNCYLREDNFDILNIDNFHGAFEMVRHLVGHGHKSIACIKGTHENIDAAERLRGYRAALKESGIENDPALEFDGDFNEQSGYRAVERILNVNPRPTAIFASNDSMAVGAMGALRTRGIAVPGGIALAGFDDIPNARFVRPSLSTVQIKISDLGHLAVGRLLAAIRDKGNHRKERTVLAADPVFRESCGCQAND